MRQAVKYDTTRKSTDKAMKMPLLETLRLAWADADIRQRLLFVLMIFTVFALGVHVPVPIPGFSAADIQALIKENPIFQLYDTFGGGGLKRVSIFALGLYQYNFLQAIQALFDLLFLF